MTEYLTKIYLITPPKIDENFFFTSLENVLSTKIVSCLQIRLKNVEDKNIIEICKMVRPICDNYKIPLIINDRLDLVKKCDADGVHLGQEDGSIKDARKYLGSNFIIGASCYNSKHIAMEAAENGADYVAFGAFFESKTKVPKVKVKKNIIEDWNFISNIPCVAIGGITPTNCKDLIKAGADHLAVIGSIWNSDKSPEKAIMDFKKILIKR